MAADVDLLVQLEQALDQMPVGVIVYDEQRRVRLFNRRFSDLFDLPPDTLKAGMTIGDIYSELAEHGFFGAPEVAQANAQKALAKFDRREAEAEGGKFHYDRRRVDGSWIQVEHTQLPDGGAMTVLSDITQRKRALARADQQQKVLQALIDNVSVAISMFDWDLTVRAFNRAYVDMYDLHEVGLEPGDSIEVIIHHLAEKGEYGEVDPDAYTAEEMAKLRAMVTQEDIPSWTRRVERRNGEVWDNHFTSLPDGSFVTLFVNVTDQVRFTEALETEKNRAEEAYRTLKDTQETLVQAEKMAALGGLVAGVAHEINTPLGVGLTSASYLAEQTRQLAARFDQGQVKKSEVAAFLKSTQKSTDLMLNNMQRAAELVASFKEVAVDQTSDERREFDLASYVHEVLLSLGPKLKRTDHSITQEIESDLTLDSYPGVLAQIVTNFVTNALMHAFEDGQAGQIRITGRPVGEAEVELAFADNGKGIPEEHKAKIFDPFFTTKRGAGGSGLGLNIVFNLVQKALGGRMTVDSKLGEGTTFTLYFPIVAPAGEAPIERASAAD